MSATAAMVSLDSSASSRLLRLLAEITSSFITVPPDRLDMVIINVQRAIVEMLGLERSSLWQFSGQKDIILTHYWQVDGWPPLPVHLNATTELPWAHAKIVNGETFHFNCVEDLPAEAAIDARCFRMYGPKSNVSIPLRINDEVLGAIAFATLSSEHAWSDEEIRGLELVASIIGNFIARQQAEQRADRLRMELARASRTSVLGELAAVLAHELNQPLAAILGNSQAAKRFIEAGQPDLTEITAILDDIIRDNKRASDVILHLRGMLDGSPAPREVCNPDELVDEVCGFLTTSLAREHIRLVRIRGTCRQHVRVARVEILQVMVNLLRNAAQAMAETPAERRIIRVQTSCPDDQFIVNVTDYGCGLPHNETALLFQPFHTTKAEGLGMGLAICRRIIDAHGGSINATNNEAGGATFSFALKLHVTASGPASCSGMRPKSNQPSG